MKEQCALKFNPEKETFFLHVRNSKDQKIATAFAWQTEKTPSWGDLYNAEPTPWSRMIGGIGPCEGIWLADQSDPVTVTVRLATPIAPKTPVPSPPNRRRLCSPNRETPESDTAAHRRALKQAR